MNEKDRPIVLSVGRFDISKRHHYNTNTFLELLAILTNMKKRMQKKSAPAPQAKKPEIKPLGDRVLVRPLSPDELHNKTASGIIIPETVDKEKAEQGTVVAVGEGKYNDNGVLMPMHVRVGDRVVFSKYSPNEIKLDGKEYYILDESSILAVVK